MSRLTNEVLKPYSKTLSWKNEKFDKKSKKVTQEKGWYYYVKSEVEGGKGENILLEAPFTFAWLLDATSFTGYNEAEGISVYSNEVLSAYDLKDLFPGASKDDIEEYQQITAKMGKEVIATGLYKDIKADVKEKGGKYCKPVYALLVADDGMEIVRILMSGSSSESWMNFANSTRLKKEAVTFSGETIEKTKGTNEYECPVFKYVTASKELVKAADEAANTVYEYFKFLLSGPKEKIETPVLEYVEDDPTDYN